MFLVYSVKDFFSEEQPKNYKDMYKNFKGFIDTLNSSLLVKLDGKDSDASKKPDVESSSSRNRYLYAGFRLLVTT
jgi:proteasome inhibitor subunit 1 (PI31)